MSGTGTGVVKKLWEVVVDSRAKEDLKDARETVNERMRAMESRLGARIDGVGQNLGTTRTELKGEIAATREEVAATRVELKGEIAGVREEVAANRTELKGEIAGVREEVTAATAGLGRRSRRTGPN